MKAGNRTSADRDADERGSRDHLWAITRYAKVNDFIAVDPAAAIKLVAAALIAVVTIAGLTTLGTTLNSRYDVIATKVGA